VISHVIQRLNIKFLEHLLYYYVVNILLYYKCIIILVANYCNFIKSLGKSVLKDGTPPFVFIFFCAMRVSHFNFNRAKAKVKQMSVAC